MRAEHKYNRATAEQVMAHVNRAVEAAMTYFGQQNGDFRVFVLAETPKENAPATCSVDLAYLRANIRVSVDHYSEHPEVIWEQMGHEVAHIVSREMLALRPQLTKQDTLEDALFTHALEACTTRLERMFVRDVPDPGWETV